MSSRRTLPLTTGQCFLGVAGGFALYLTPRDARSSYEAAWERLLYMLGVAFVVGLVLLWLKRYETVGIAVVVGVALTLFNFFRYAVERAILFPGEPLFVLDYREALSWGVMWLLPVIMCVIVRLCAVDSWDRPEKRAQFSRFFRVSSTAFFLFYAVLILLCFGVLRDADPSGERVWRLIPFEQIRSYLSAGGTGTLYFVGNLLILAPVGFYAAIYRPRWRWWGQLLAGLGCSVLLELLQFALNSGVASVDDILLSAVGVTVGILLKWLLDLLRRLRTGGEEKSIFIY